MRTRLLCGVAAVLLAAGCARAQVAPNWSAEDRAAVGTMVARAKGQRTLTLDLGDPVAARFLKRHFENAGFTQDKYPGFHQLLVQQSVQMAKTGVSGPRVTTLSDDLIYEDLTTQMLALYTSGAQQYTGVAAASMEAPSDDQRTLQISYTSLCFYDQNNNPIGTCSSSSSFGSGQYFPINNTLANSAQKFTAVFSATYYDATNQRYVAQMSTLGSDTVAAPQQQTISNPVIVHPANNSLAAALLCTSRTVNANANPGTCDYGTYQNTDVLLSMGGSITYTAAQTPQVNGQGQLVGNGSVSLINTVQGGGCLINPTISGNNFFAQPQVQYNAATKTLSWNFTNLDFGSATTLICGGDGTAVQFSLVTTATDTVTGNALVASQYSVVGTIAPHLVGPDAGALATPMLRIVAGCLHPDTRITLANGRTVPISSLKGEGELIRTAQGNRRVVGTTVGDDTELFVITTSNGLSVRATAQHPFVGRDGSFVAAAALKVGTSIRTATGAATVRSVTRTPYKGKVYNLVMEHPLHEAPTLASDSFVADGFVVGGHDAQQQIAQAVRRQPARVEALLPAMLRKDYESHRARTGAKR